MCTSTSERTSVLAMRTCWDGNEPWPLCDPDPEPDKPEGGKDLRLELLDERLPDFLLAFLTLMAFAGQPLVVQVMLRTLAERDHLDSAPVAPRLTQFH